VKVAITIVSYRSADDIRALLDALARQTHREFSVHVCENAGDQGYDNLLQALEAGGYSISAAQPDPEKRVNRAASTRLASGAPVDLYEAADNLGYAGGVNLCIDNLADKDWAAIWIINPDAIPAPDALEALLRHQRNGSYGIVGGRLIFAGTGKVQCYGGIWRRWMARGLNLGFSEPVTANPDVAGIEAKMDYVSGACMLITRGYVETIGKMREDYFLYCEEVDWCARRGSFRLGFAPAARIEHGHGATIGSHRDRRLRSRLSVYLDERNKLLLTKHLFPAIYPLVLGTTLLLTAQYLRHGAVANFGHALSGWWAGVRGETGRPRWTRGKA